MINYNNINQSPPSISLTSSAYGDSEEKTRSRAGTLPSNYMNNNVLTLNSHHFGESSSPLVSAITNESLVLPPLDSISISPSPNQNNIDIPGSQGQGESSRRMRSGSLFSTNSIWNDDASNHSPSQLNSLIMDGTSLYSFENATNNSSSNMFLSPAPGAQGSSLPQNGNLTGFSNTLNLNGQRNRSYTTTATNSNLNIPMPNGGFGMDPLNSQRLSSQLNTANNKPNDMNSLLDNMMLNMINVPMINNRTRSQTFSGSVPITTDSMQNQIYNSTLLSGQQNQSPNKTNHIQQISYVPKQNQTQPVLQDNCDFSQMAITTNFENTNLAPTTFLLFDNLPIFVDSVKLLSILNNSLGSNRATGSIKGVSISSTSTSKLALVSCSSVEIAMSLKASFNHLELVPGAVLYVAFAKVMEKIDPEPALQKPVVEKPKSSPIDVLAIRESLLNSIDQLRGNSKNIDIKKIISSINKSVSYPNENYQDNFGPLPDPIPLRQFDSPKLRELRKILENNENSNSPRSLNSNASESEGDEITDKMTQLELEELCLAMLDELPELCYDYLGNTIVQKLFALVESPLIKLMMVKEIAPFLTQLSIHKNGTWAIQKIINLCDSDFQQKYLIGASLKPYTVRLFNDQFGNYVLQGCVKFGSPFNDFIFETLIDNFLEISSGRFGARCIRTILETANENNAISNEQVLLVAGLIVQFANELAVNSNGSLLITWFLDTFVGFGGIDNRYQLLAKAFLPNLAKLCTHKLANLTILKMLNNRSDLAVKAAIMDSIFGNFQDLENENANKPSKLLEFILNESPENTAGPLFIYKILSNAMLIGGNDDFDRAKNLQYQQFIIMQIKRILLEININNFQPYKKLMDEVGLPSARINRSASGSRRGKRNSRSNGKIQSHMQPPPMQPSQQGIISSMPYGNKQVHPQYNGLQYSQNFQPFPQVSQQSVLQSQIPQQQRLYQQHELEMVVLQQLEQLSLSSAALAYNSTPGTPSAGNNQNHQFF